ncbi:hypothetical protein RCC89_01885 [Cytophagaceae bacterium ABcell3]|nr:hypothetical protein RCC89_01885 [Cytophagaceae bacterium ABcell3]
MKNFRYTISSSYGKFRAMPTVAVIGISVIAFFMIPLILGILFVFATVALGYILVRSLLPKKKNSFIKQTRYYNNNQTIQTIEIEGEVVEEKKTPTR